MKLHMRGVELLTELLDAADQIERMKPAEMRRLLKETAIVLSDLLARDFPSGPKDDQSL
jgi:hypothetical protein